MQLTVLVMSALTSTSALQLRSPFLAKPVIKQPDPASKVLTLRGGAADIGPITPYNVGMASAAFGALYFVQMFFMTEKAGEMYWGANNEPKSVQAKTMTKWFGLAILNQAIIGFWTLYNGFDPVMLCKASTVTWGTAFLLYYKNHVQDGLLVDPSGMFVQGAFVLLSGYFGFM